MAKKENEVSNIERKSLPLEPERHLLAKNRHNNIGEIQYDDLGDNKLEIYVYKKEKKKKINIVV